MLGHDLEMSWTKFHENRLIIDGEIDKKHALLVECGQGYSHLLMLQTKIAFGSYMFK